MLEKYNQKRDFSQTPEPSGLDLKPNNPELAFVVQEHHAQNLHWDFRLEHEGVLASWAIPKGPPANIGDKRLAVQVEDHPLEYAKFTGDIPKDQYGGGHVDIWDQGTFETIKWDKDVVEVIMMGQKMTGRYTLVKTKGYGKNSWILMKQKPKSSA